MDRSKFGEEFVVDTQYNDNNLEEAESNSVKLLEEVMITIVYSMTQRGQH
jgi:hypothetical protein